MQGTEFSCRGYQSVPGSPQHPDGDVATSIRLGHIADGLNSKLVFIFLVMTTAG